MKFYVVILFLFITLIPPDKNVQRKIISDSEFNYTFYVLIKNTTSNKINKFYHWFKSGEIHSSQGSSSGNLLHGVYTKSYKNNDLAEQGSFKKGLKNEIWKSWYRNGRLYEVSKWKNGAKTGRYLQFSDNGKIVIQGNYENGRKHGQWVDNTTKDTLYFRKGETIEKPKKYSRKPFPQRTKLFFKNLFSKKEKDSLQPNTQIKASTADTKSERRAKKQKRKREREQNKIKKEK